MNRLCDRRTKGIGSRGGWNKMRKEWEGKKERKNM
jgi:hypothetical protein